MALQVVICEHFIVNICPSPGNPLKHLCKPILPENQVPGLNFVLSLQLLLCLWKPQNILERDTDMKPYHITF